MSYWARYEMETAHDIFSDFLELTIKWREGKQAQEKGKSECKPMSAMCPSKRVDSGCYTNSGKGQISDTEVGGGNAMKVS